MLKNLGITIGIILIIIFIAIGSFVKSFNMPNSSAEEELKILIESGQGVKQIATKLEENELIKKTSRFSYYIWFKGWGEKLQAGEYTLSKNMSIAEIAERIATGQTESNENIIKIIEGWDISEIGHYLETQGMFQAEELMELVGFPKIDYRLNKKMPTPKDFSAEYSFLADKPKYYNLEGYLFPDTYRVFKDATIEDVVKKMLSNFDKKITAEMRAEINRQGKTVYEILTLASIIEKEVVDPEEMKMISDIFYKRIKDGIALQSDATVNFITHKGTTRPSLDDLAVDDPYNTYKYRGLPPGPIANPGLAAIEAAIYPTTNSYYYFLTTPEGEAIYSKTYNEHLTNQYNYYK